MKQTLKFIGVILFVLCVFLFSVHTAQATVSPIAWWKFDDGSGTAPVDSSGNNITGAFAGGSNPTWSTDVPSTIGFSDPYSLSFSGTSGVTFTWPANLDFGATAPRSFSFWYKPTGNGQNSTGQNRLINWSGNAFDISGDFGSNTTRDIGYYDGNWHDTGFAVSIGTWYHITFTYDGATERMFINDTDQLDTSLVGRTLQTTIVIGNDPTNYDIGINGLIDDVRVYDVALTSTQISNLTAGSNDPDSAPTTPTPTPAPTSTPTPTSTPAPTSASSSSSSSNSSNDQSSCVSTSINGSPNLYEIDPSQTSATLYFTPVSGADGYTISYGTDYSADQYATSFSYSDQTGAVAYTINSLDTNTTYYFKVKDTKGCSSSNWSNIVSANTKQDSGILSQIVNTFTPKKKIDIVKSGITSEPITPTPIPQLSSNPTQQTGLNLAVKVLDENNKPLAGAQVTLHSKIQTTKTDKNGVAHFTNVEKGEHRLLLSYGGYNGEQHMSVDGIKKEQTLTIQVKLTNGMPWGWFALVSCLFVVIIGIFVFLLLKKRKQGRGLNNWLH